MLLASLGIVSASNAYRSVTHILNSLGTHFFILLQLMRISTQLIPQQEDFTGQVTHTELSVLSLFSPACAQRSDNSRPMNTESKAMPTPWPMNFIERQRRTLSLCTFHCHSCEYELGAYVETPTLKMREEITIHIVTFL